MRINFITLLAAGALALTFGCASGHSEPLPAPPAPKLAWNPLPEATQYQAFYLTNTAPDFPLGTNSVNWTPLPVVTLTNCPVATVPAGALLTVIASDGQGTVSAPAAPIVNPGIKTLSAVKITLK